MNLEERQSEAIKITSELIEELEAIADNLNDDENIIREAKEELEQIVSNLESKNYDDVILIANSWNNPQYDTSFNLRTASSRGIDDLEGIEVQLSDIAQEYITLQEDDNE